MVSDKKGCMTKVREERKEEEGKGCQTEVLCYTLAIRLQHIHLFRSDCLVNKVG